MRRLKQRGVQAGSLEAATSSGAFRYWAFPRLRASKLLDLGARYGYSRFSSPGLLVRRLSLNFLRITAALHNKPMPTYIQ